MKKIRNAFVTLVFLMMTISIACAADFNEALKPVSEGIERFLVPILLIVGAFGIVFCICLGTKVAKAEEQQEREKAKSQLKAAVIGFLLIFLLIVGLKLFLPVFTEWMENSTAESSS